MDDSDHHLWFSPVTFPQDNLTMLTNFQWLPVALSSGWLWSPWFLLMWPQLPSPASSFAAPNSTYVYLTLTFPFPK